MNNTNNIINRNATPTWSGFMHQGKVGLLIALREINKFIDSNTRNLPQKYSEYTINYENAEDFDITDNAGNAISRHQVKAYKNKTSINDYEGPRTKEQTTNIKGVKKISTPGFRTNGSPQDQRFLHTVTNVEGFSLSEDEYKQDFPRRKFVENTSGIQLYEYEKDTFFCPLTTSEDQDSIRQYCHIEIKAILRKMQNTLLDNPTHFNQFFNSYIASTLDTKIGSAHVNSKHPQISFSEILELLLKEDYDFVNDAKNTLIVCWEEFKSDYDQDLGFEPDIIEKADSFIYEIYNKTSQDFENIFRDLYPGAKKDEKLSNILNKQLIQNILLELLLNIGIFDLKTLTYHDTDNVSYMMSLISTLNKPMYVGNLVEKLGNDTNFFLRIFNSQYLINENITKTKIFENIIDDEINGKYIENSYRKEWRVRREDNILINDLEFINVEDAEKKLGTF
ncbi:ABC-three component system protein [Leuconostoc lactis]|uniref:ABC-three component system protein n=1 Tax=Leuconostoc lactis TaxID=1246 RepID=UPI0021A705A6|nr:ABC-three component system protein [Leuconostoc lactis]MCT3115794.1 hypothetical protein [Leuconostoc lactis]